MNFPIVKHRNAWFLFSAASIVVSVVAVLVFGLRFSIDFTGGSLLEVVIPSVESSAEIEEALQDAKIEGATIQSTDENGWLIRTRTLSEVEHQTVLSELTETFAEVEEKQFDSIGPSIGTELRKTALIGVVITLALIGLYVAWAYRKVSEPIASWKYALLTVFTAFHDVIIAVGAFAILGHFLGWEVGAAFVAAVLTILGYSISDTVVVFDRTRENLSQKTGESFAEVVEKSIHQTITRSLNTSITTLLALVAIFGFGGESTRPFAFALIIGIAFGTYSSIFIASPALVAWEQWKTKRG